MSGRKKKKSNACWKDGYKKQQKYGSVPQKFESESEVAEHVSYMYLHGPGGILHNKPRHKKNQPHQCKKKRATAAASTSLSSFETEQSTKTDSMNEAVRNLNCHPALVLNADYQPLSFLPLSLWSWQDAIKAVFSGKVVVVDVYPDIVVRAASLEIAVPSVIALTDYVALGHHKPAFTKRNVFLRDEYRCQYCNNQFSTRDLSLDHVHPRCMGGKLEWENTVTSCHRCNGRKGSLPVSKLPSIGMKLLRPPKVPTQYELAAIAGRMLPRKVHPTWQPYLGLMDETMPISSNDDANSNSESSLSSKSKH